MTVKRKRKKRKIVFTAEIVFAPISIMVVVPFGTSVEKAKKKLMLAARRFISRKGYHLVKDVEFIQNYAKEPHV